MSDNSVHFFNPDARSEWVRLRTLILLRWMAVIGQAAAVLVAVYFLALDISIITCFAIIATSVFANIIAITRYPENKRLSDKEAMFTLLFDLAQLILLLFFTGGLNNPFALLINGSPILPSISAGNPFPSSATLIIIFDSDQFKSIQTFSEAKSTAFCIKFLSP